MPKPLWIIGPIWILLIVIFAAVAWRLGFQFWWVAFWGVAFFVSSLHMIPGWAYGLYSFSGPFEERKSNKTGDAWTLTVSVDGRPTMFWTQVYALHHALTYFVSSLTGFAALYILINNNLSGMTEVTPSKAAVLIALFFFAVAGLSGALGRILTQIKGLPGIGGN
jgi:hypothetical protein